MISEAIIEKIKIGDLQALKYVYELYYGSAYKAAFFITKDAGLAEDAVHETFIRLKDKIEQLEDHSKLGLWICRIAINKARDILRQRSKSTLYEDVRSIYKDDQNLCPETIYIINEEITAIQNYINLLHPYYKDVIYKKYYEQLTISEISKILGVPEGTIKYRLYQARKEIKRLMKNKNIIDNPIEIQGGEKR